jgi:hypothetical protein
MDDGKVNAEQYKPIVISDKSLATPVEVTKHEIEVQQTKALTSLAEGVNAIAAFITGGGMSELLSGYARTQAVQSILGGLASHDGRNALDARVLGQNAVEIVEQIEKVFDKYHSRKTSTERRDPVIHTEDDRPKEGETRNDYFDRMKDKYKE